MDLNSIASKGFRSSLDYSGQKVEFDGTTTLNGVIGEGKRIIKAFFTDDYIEVDGITGAIQGSSPAVSVHSDDVNGAKNGDKIKVNADTPDEITYNIKEIKTGVAGATIFVLSKD